MDDKEYHGMMYDGLTRCPFCGAENTDVGGFVKHTDDCYLMIKYMGGPDKKKRLTEAWNKCPQEDKLRAELIAAKDRNAEIEAIAKVRLNAWQMAQDMLAEKDEEIEKLRVKLYLETVWSGAYLELYKISCKKVSYLLDELTELQRNEE